MKWIWCPSYTRIGRSDRAHASRVAGITLEARSASSILTSPEVKDSFNTTLSRAFCREVPVKDSISAARCELAVHHAAKEEGRWHRGILPP